MNLNNIFDNASYQMANVSKKTITERKALATGRIIVGKEVFAKIQQGSMPKGDPLTLAETAAILGAKKTADIIPLCHPLGLDHVRVAITTEGDDAFRVYCLTTTTAKTGVEMEALAAVSAALLTIWDLSKPVYADLKIEDIRLLQKTGGKSGTWRTSQDIPKVVADYFAENSVETHPLKGYNASVITMSTRASQGVYEDTSGAYLKDRLTTIGANIEHYEVIADDAAKLKETLCACSSDLILITGGTGLCPDDTTPEVLSEIMDKNAPGFAEYLRLQGSQFTYKSWLSRQNAIVKGHSLIIALPGSLKAVKENLGLLEILLPHALKMLKGGRHD
ncbi:MAG: bifunctional molybdenum cofactor biosynthesis protein MoaC/MoaB [Alphaproteobacteria bacterium]